MDKPLARLRKEKGRELKIINERGDITNNTTEVQQIIGNYYKN